MFAYLSYLLPFSFLIFLFIHFLNYRYLLPSRIGPLISWPDIVGGDQTWF